MDPEQRRRISAWADRLLTEVLRHPAIVEAVQAIPGEEVVLATAQTHVEDLAMVVQEDQEDNSLAIL